MRMYIYIYIVYLSNDAYRNRLIPYNQTKRNVQFDALIILVRIHKGSGRISLHLFICKII